MVSGGHLLLPHEFGTKFIQYQDRAVYLQWCNLMQRGYNQKFFEKW